jgi:hypothetical protein
MRERRRIGESSLAPPTCEIPKWVKGSMDLWKKLTVTPHALPCLGRPYSYALEISDSHTYILLALRCLLLLSNISFTWISLFHRALARSIVYAPNPSFTLTP